MGLVLDALLRQGVVESPFYSRPHSLPNFNSYRYANATLYGNGKAGINTRPSPSRCARCRSRT